MQHVIIAIVGRTPTPTENAPASREIQNNVLLLHEILPKDEVSILKEVGKDMSCDSEHKGANP